MALLHLSLSVYHSYIQSTLRLYKTKCVGGAISVDGVAWVLLLESVFAKGTFHATNAGQEDWAEFMCVVRTRGYDVDGCLGVVCGGEDVV